MEFKHLLILGLALCLVLPMLSAQQGDLYKIYPDVLEVFERQGPWDAPEWVSIKRIEIA